MKAKGSSDGDTGMLLQQSCQPGSCHQHSLLLQETRQKCSFLAEIVLRSGLAEAALSSGNAPSLLPLPKAHLDHAGTDELRRGLLSPRGIGGCKGRGADSGAEVRPAPRAPLRSSCCSVPGSPNPKSCKKHPASGADEVLGNARQLIKGQRTCQTLPARRGGRTTTFHISHFTTFPGL